MPAAPTTSSKTASIARHRAGRRPLPAGVADSEPLGVRRIQAPGPTADPPHFLRQAAGWLVSFVAITVLFALIFKMMPNVSLEWGDVAIGAVFTSLTFTAGKFCWDFISPGPASPTPTERPDRS